MLDDLVRMSSSAVYSGEPSQTREVVEFEDHEASRRPVSQYDLKLAASHHEFATMTLNSRRDPLKKLSVETCVRYLNISYYAGQSHLDKYKIISSKMWSFFSEGVTSWTIHP